MVEARATALALIFLLGCGDPGEQPTPGDPTDGCPLAERDGSDGGCIPAGLPPDLACPPGEGVDELGACVPAGVPPSGCGVGFVHDGFLACEPVLPASPCPFGLFAVPGDPACREVAGCGSGTWGLIVVEANTQYVDRNSTAPVPDGSSTAPWTTIQQGIDAAAPGAIVAVAEGAYAEDVAIEDKPVRLWGRCPDRVAIVGSGQELGAVVVGEGASSSTVTALEVTGTGLGVLVSGSEDVVLQQLWVHGLTDRGIDIEGSFGPTRVIVRDTLVEDIHDFGVFVIGAEATVERTGIRDVIGTGSPSEPGAGVGLGTYGGGSYPPTEVTIRGSLIERTPTGVHVQGETVTVEDTVVRDTVGIGRTGGIILQVPCFECIETVPTATVRRSVIQGVRPAGIAAIGGILDVEHVVVRNVLSDTTSSFGSGIALAQLCALDGNQPVCNPALRSTGTVRASLVAAIAGRGIHVWGSDAIIERVAVLDSPTLVTTASYPALDVDSICHDATGATVCDATPGGRANATITSSLIERGQGVAVLVGGSDAVIETTVVRNTFPNIGGFGRGLQVQDQCGAYACLGGALIPASAELRSSLIEISVDSGIAVIGSMFTMSSSVVRGTVAGADGLYGDGLLVFSYTSPASATISDTRIEQSARSALANFGANVSLGGNALVCQAFDLNGELYAEQPYQFENRGNNGCGCPEPMADCQSKSANLTPPPPLDPGSP